MNRSREEYLAVLNDLAGGPGQVYEMTDPGDVRPVLAIAYNGIPEPGHMTAFSFGLSNSTHSEWTHGKPELMISIKSLDHAWALCLGEIVRINRDSVLFEYGTILHFRERIVDECPLTSFLVFASTLLDGAQRTLDLSDRRINIAQVYPIYESETRLLRDIGIERFFWELGIDFSDLSRKPAQPDSEKTAEASRRR